MNQNELYHYGIKGQQWGKRRYQNEDGSYKPGAEGRYAQDDSGNHSNGNHGSGSRFTARKVGKLSSDRNNAPTLPTSVVDKKPPEVPASKSKPKPTWNVVPFVPSSKSNRPKLPSSQQFIDDVASQPASEVIKNSNLEKAKNAIRQFANTTVSTILGIANKAKSFISNLFKKK